MGMWGGGAALAVATPALLLGGGPALAGAACGGALAGAAQVAAVALLRPGMGAPTRQFVRRWAGGVAVRAVSALVLVGLVLATRALWPPLATTAGFLAVLLTLLYAETRFLE